MIYARRHNQYNLADADIDGQWYELLQCSGQTQ